MNELDGWTKVDVGSMRKQGDYGLRTSMRGNSLIIVASSRLARDCSGCTYAVYSKDGKIGILPDPKGRTMGTGTMPVILKGLQNAGLKVLTHHFYPVKAIAGDIKNGFEVIDQPVEIKLTERQAARKAANPMHGVLEGDPETWGKIVLACARHSTDPAIVKELGVGMATVKKIRTACSVQIEQIVEWELISNRDAVKGLLQRMVDQWTKEAARNAQRKS